MKSKYIITGLILLLVVGVVSAFSIISLGQGQYQLNLDDGRTAIAYNISYSKTTDIATLNINTSDGRGLSMKDLTDARAYVAALNGRAGKMGLTTVKIN